MYRPPWRSEPSPSTAVPFSALVVGAEPEPCSILQPILVRLTQIDGVHVLDIVKRTSSKLTLLPALMCICVLECHVCREMH